jgi:uncharacterized protein (DUF1778 family)
MLSTTRAGRPAAQRRDVTINLRVSVPLRNLIDQAAAVLGKTRSEFMLESARRSAEAVLLEQTVFPLDAKKFNAFMAILEQPPKPNDELKELLKTKAPWEM